ncbi:MAG: DUF4129 domain-containing protein, partial [Spirulinaceae cyanobacterium RM2_2_10]|nr:DUF4129 domain-containing protein [Spirulinaceae cyanobacterium RM2_2_10]
ITAFLSWLWLGTMQALVRLLAGLWRFFSGSAIGLLTGAIAALASGFGLWLVWQRWRDWLDFQRLRRLPPMERLYQQLVRELATRGVARDPAQTPLEYARRVGEQQQAPISEPAHQIVQAYVRWRYGDADPDLPQLQAQFRRLRRLRRPGRA